MKSAKELVAAAKEKIENLLPGEAAKELESGALLVDLRESEELAEHGSIPGSVHMPRGMLEFYADPSLPYYRPELIVDRRIILHCASGGRSALAAATLSDMGYTNVAHIDGGLKAWREEGRTVDRG